jgi:hypothetical protein
MSTASQTYWLAASNCVQPDFFTSPFHFEICRAFTMAIFTICRSSKLILSCCYKLHLDPDLGGLPFSRLDRIFQAGFTAKISQIPSGRQTRACSSIKLHMVD